MIDLEAIPHHPAIEEIVDTLSVRIQNPDRPFFRVMAAYFLGKMASSMRAVVKSRDRGEIPVNVYAVALAPSGFGKGHSVGILETEFMEGFRRRFMDDTFPTVSQHHLWKLASARAAWSGNTEEQEKKALDKEFRSAGSMAFTFDSATPAAVKQLRHKLLLAAIGSINLQIDEIGSNLMGSADVLPLFLELYDQGRVKQKLTKNTAENVRAEEIEGKTPTNALLFGTPSKLLDGAQVEESFTSFLDIGFARRSIFAWGMPTPPSETLTPAEIYALLVQPNTGAMVSRWANHFAELADPARFGWAMDVPDDVGIELLTYKIHCEKLAAVLPEHEHIRKAEMAHRYFKVLKLAGALAFVEESSEVTLLHLHQAMKIVEESGQAFERVMTREKREVKLAKYIASCKRELTQSDLMLALPFYKGTAAARSEMMTLATSWAYRQHIIIRKTFLNGIEFFSGETLEATDLNRMILSYSDHEAFNYQTEDAAPFDQLHLLTQAPGLHWANHRFERGHRCNEAALPGFNMVVVDVDGTIPLYTVHELMKDYTFMTYTTKRHTDDQHRFRLIMPTNLVLQLKVDEYREFMNGVLEWLPFDSDISSNEASKKWLTHEGGQYHYNQGAPLDALRFIPKTTKNEEHRQEMIQLGNLDNLERWFAQRMANGNRNNQMIKYALALVDGGLGLHEVEDAVLNFNGKLHDPLAERELRDTVLKTAAKRIAERMVA